MVPLLACALDGDDTTDGGVDADEEEEEDVWKRMQRARMVLQ